MNSGMLPLRGTALFLKIVDYLFVYSMCDMQKKKNTNYDILYDMTS